MSSYAVLPAAAKDEEELYKKMASTNSTTSPSRGYFLVFFLSIITSLVFGVDMGWQLSAHYAAKEQILSRSSGLLSDLGGVKTVFKYDRIYAEMPTNESDAAWKEIFPARGGFFKHPQLAPGGSGLAVFHQLHCLDNIRRGYWSLTDDGRHVHHISPAHIRHCIDYLRQSLMCHADTNVETLDEMLHGVHGFGVEHKCRDFEGVRNWISKWEDGIIQPTSK